MATLVEKITAPDVQPKVIEDTLQLIESEVAGKRGLAGVAVKAGYKVIKALKPGMIRDAVTNLLPEFAGALEPMYVASGAAEGGADAGDKFARHLKADASGAADLMLKVTDAKAARASNKTLQKTYGRLRGSAQKHVSDAVPGLATTLSKYC